MWKCTVLWAVICGVVLVSISFRAWLSNKASRVVSRKPLQIQFHLISNLSTCKEGREFGFFCCAIGYLITKSGYGFSDRTFTPFYILFLRLNQADSLELRHFVKLGVNFGAWRRCVSDATAAPFNPELEMAWESEFLKRIWNHGNSFSWF